MWNFKVTLWNSTQNIWPIHWKIWFLYNIKILRAHRFKSSYAVLKCSPSYTYSHGLQQPWSWPSSHESFWPHHHIMCSIACAEYFQTFVFWCCWIHYIHLIIIFILISGMCAYSPVRDMTRLWANIIMYIVGHQWQSLHTKSIYPQINN